MAERAIKPISEECMVGFEINYSALSSGVVYFVDF
jgi:hypothetical protein